MKTFFLAFIFLAGIVISCSKQNSLTPQPAATSSFISFKQDTIPVNLSITSSQKQSIGSLSVIAIQGQLPDSSVSKNNLVIRVTGDSARAYTNTEIFASYTDSLGNAYASTINDTINKVTFIKLQQTPQGMVQGNFTIRVSNTTKTKTLLLNQGKFSTNFSQ
jgi:hypothetical protein